MLSVQEIRKQLEKWGWSCSFDGNGTGRKATCSSTHPDIEPLNDEPKTLPTARGYGPTDADAPRDAYDKIASGIIM